MTRVPNWPLALATTVETWRHRPFAYGRADCLQFPAECVLAITGVDYRDCFPRYASELAAGRILVRCGGIAGLISSLLVPKPVALAQRGDLVAGDFGGGLTAAVCLGTHCAVPGRVGLEFRRTAEAVMAWSV